VLVEARGAGNTFRDRVITTEYEEKDALLGAEVTRSLAVEMEELVTAERKGFIGRNGLTAARAVGDRQWLKSLGDGSTLRRQQLGTD